MFILQVLSVFACLLFLIFVLRQIARGRLQLQYALLWFFLIAVMLICSLFPDKLSTLSMVLGFKILSNFIFFIATFCLLAITLSLSIIVSKQSSMIKAAIQRIALLEKQLYDSKAAKQTDVCDCGDNGE